MPIDAFLGLHFTGDVDATGVATALLALATFLLAAYTRSAVLQGATELAQSQRPVLVPVTDWSGGPNTVAVCEQSLFLPVSNIGLGPAMSIEGHVEFGDVTGAPSAAPPARGEASRTALGPGQIATLEFEHVGLSDTMGFVFNIEFRDVAGRAWVSQGRYSEADHRFTQLDLIEGPLNEAMRLRLSPRAGRA